MHESGDLGEIHWMLDALQRIEVGLVILDRDFRVRVWNGFMEHHSDISPAAAQGRSLFELVPELPRAWLERKLSTVLTLNTTLYSTWQQRPHLFPFQAQRPLSGEAEYMFQSLTLSPLGSVDGQCNHVCLMLYDVTDEAVGRRRLEAANRDLEVLSSTDRLTGLFNRGHWEEQLRREFKRFRRYGVEASLVMFDIDHFKAVNDNHGHQAGDEVLRVLGATLQDAVRDTDVAGRYGGEEFAVVLSDTDARGALAFCERLRTTAAMLEVAHEESRIGFTISLGVAPLGAELTSADSWIAQADQALYHSKENGRNRTSCFRSDSSQSSNAK